MRKGQLDDNLELISFNIKKQLPFKVASYDCVSALAVLEHLSHPTEILEECFRILKKGGSLILTTPSPSAKPVLELLAFRLHLIPQEDIQEHKTYFSKDRLCKILKTIGFKIVTLKTFEFGFNIFVLAKKS